MESETSGVSAYPEAVETPAPVKNTTRLAFFTIAASFLILASSTSSASLYSWVVYCCVFVVHFVVHVFLLILITFLLLQLAWVHMWTTVLKFSRSSHPL